MRCPVCASPEHRVVDSRPTADGEAIRRRRQCLACDSRFTTFERTVLPELTVRKRSGDVVPFQRAKVTQGMDRAAKGRIPPGALDRAAAAVEAQLRIGGSTEVTSEQVGLQVLAQLRELDPVAYVRFASVYEDFQVPEDFEQALSSLRKEAPPKR